MLKPRGLLSMYARIVNGAIVGLGNPSKEWDEGRWWDLRDSGIRAFRGWAEVIETPRPSDTEAGTYEQSVQVVNGQPVRTWAFRNWTSEEAAERAEAERENTLRATLSSGIQEAIARRQAMLSSAAALETSIAGLSSVTVAAVKALGNNVVALARATARGEEDLIALARLYVRALDSTEV